MTTPFFSVILPVYKVEKYLRQCVDSVLSQNYDNYEVILVDDGSPDSCPQICDDYASRFARVRTVHRENGGLSAARNSGLSACSASEDPHYVIYLDSDDYWESSDALAHIADNILQHNSDVVIFGCYNLYPDGNKKVSRGNYDLDYISSHSKKEILNHLFQHNQFPGAAWHIATRKDLLTDHKIRFTEGITGEDYEWLIKLFFYAEKISAINDCITIYRYVVPGSLTSKSRPSGMYGLFCTIDTWDLLRTAEKDYFDNYMVRIYLFALKGLWNFKGEQQLEFRNKLVQYGYVCKRTHKLSHKLLYLTILILGVKYTSKLVNILYDLIYRHK